jgi:hypothetical protein
MTEDDVLTMLADRSRYHTHGRRMTFEDMLQLLRALRVPLGAAWVEQKPQRRTDAARAGNARYRANHLDQERASGRERMARLRTAKRAA